MGTNEDGAAAPKKEGDGGAADMGAAAAVGWAPNEKIAGSFFCSPSVIVSCERLFASVNC